MQKMVEEKLRMKELENFANAERFRSSVAQLQENMQILECEKMSRSIPYVWARSGYNSREKGDFLTMDIFHSFLVFSILPPLDVRR